MYERQKRISLKEKVGVASVLLGTVTQHYVKQKIPSCVFLFQFIVTLRCLCAESFPTEIEGLRN